MADDLISQDDIEKLFGQKSEADPARKPTEAAGDQPMAQDELEKLLAESAQPAGTATAAPPKASPAANV